MGSGEGHNYLGILFPKVRAMFVRNYDTVVLCVCVCVVCVHVCVHVCVVCVVCVCVCVVHICEYM